MKSGLYSQFETNEELEVNGIEVEFPEAQNPDGSIPTFLLSRMGKSNKRYSKALEASTRPYRRQIELGTMKNETAENVFMNVFVDTVLLGWKNVLDRNGERMQFARGNAVKLLTELPDIYERLQEEAKLASNFRVESLEVEAKN